MEVNLLYPLYEINPSVTGNKIKPAVAGK